MTFVDYGRCRSGRRWFWYAAVVDYSYPRCEDPACKPGLHPHEYGWSDTEEVALKAIAAAVESLGGELNRRKTEGWAGTASRALKRINEAKRRARLPSPETSARIAEYLYEAYTFWPEDGPEVRQVRPWQIARRTAKRIYFADGTFASREELETDTRCPGRADGLDRCEHGHWNSHGYPPGEMVKDGRSWCGLAHLFASRELAEAHLGIGADPAPAAPGLRELRQAMAAVHPDRGGSNEEFIAARARYEKALRRPSMSLSNSAKPKGPQS